MVTSSSLIQGVISPFCSAKYPGHLQHYIFSQFTPIREIFSARLLIQKTTRMPSLPVVIGLTFFLLIYRFLAKNLVIFFFNFKVKILFSIPQDVKLVGKQCGAGGIRKKCKNSLSLRLCHDSSLFVVF